MSKKITVREALVALVQKQVNLLGMQDVIEEIKEEKDNSKHFVLRGAGKKRILSVIDNGDELDICILSSPSKQFYLSDNDSPYSKKYKIIQIAAEFTAELVREKLCSATNGEVERDIAFY